MLALGGPGYGGIEAVVSVVLIEREGCAQETATSTGSVQAVCSFSQQSGWQETAVA